MKERLPLRDKADFLSTASLQWGILAIAPPEADQSQQWQAGTASSTALPGWEVRGRRSAWMGLRGGRDRQGITLEQLLRMYTYISEDRERECGPGIQRALGAVHSIPTHSTANLFCAAQVSARRAAVHRPRCWGISIALYYRYDYRFCSCQRYCSSPQIKNRRFYSDDIQ